MHTWFRGVYTLFVLRCRQHVMSPTLRSAGFTCSIILSNTMFSTTSSGPLSATGHQGECYHRDDECSGRVQEKVVTQTPGQRRVQLSISGRLRLHGDVLVCGIRTAVLGDESLLPLQPVSDHVPFPLWDRDRPRPSLCCSQCSQCGIEVTGLTLTCSVPRHSNRKPLISSSR